MSELLDPQTLQDIVILSGLLISALVFGLLGMWVSRYVFAALRMGLGFLLGAATGACLFVFILSAIEPYLQKF